MTTPFKSLIARTQDGVWFSFDGGGVASEFGMHKPPSLDVKGLSLRAVTFPGDLAREVDEHFANDFEHPGRDVISVVVYWPQPIELAHSSRLCSPYVVDSMTSNISLKFEMLKQNGKIPDDTCANFAYLDKYWQPHGGEMEVRCLASSYPHDDKATQMIKDLIPKSWNPQICYLLSICAPTIMDTERILLTTKEPPFESLSWGKPIDTANPVTLHEGCNRFLLHNSIDELVMERKKIFSNYARAVLRTTDDPESEPFFHPLLQTRYAKTHLFWEFGKKVPRYYYHANIARQEVVVYTRTANHKCEALPAAKMCEAREIMTAIISRMINKGIVINLDNEIVTPLLSRIRGGLARFSNVLGTQISKASGPTTIKMTKVAGYLLDLLELPEVSQYVTEYPSMPAAPTCPVHLGPVDDPLLLTCGHAYCHDCFIAQLMSKTVPFACARCDMMPTMVELQCLVYRLDDKFMRLLQDYLKASVKASIAQVPHKLTCCKMPDCGYLIPATTLKYAHACRGCLARVCSLCGEAWHEDKECYSNENVNNVEGLKVKLCPGAEGRCRQPLARADGCNSVQCKYGCLSYVCFWGDCNAYHQTSRESHDHLIQAHGSFWDREDINRDRLDDNR